MTTTTLHVTGMTCEHCVRAVTTELEKVDGVDRVEVDLSSGAVTVTSGRPLPEQDLRAAVVEAGYETVS
ncbi:MAG: heavy-metal-associated domain-containing protein [Acidimicrobiia bacterium]|nr:heavy-metal-associated domain-containing protein [Acidimicrobiia bacterium]